MLQKIGCAKFVILLWLVLGSSPSYSFFCNSSLDGTWNLVGTNANEISRVQIWPSSCYDRSEGGINVPVIVRSMHVWGACQPRQCYLGVANLERYGEWFRASYEIGSKTSTFWLKLYENEYLYINVTNDWHGYIPSYSMYGWYMRQ